MAQPDSRAKRREEEGGPGSGEDKGRARLLTTGDMARLSESTLRTVRFYEEAGLLSPVGRRDGGHRLFREGDLYKLQLILDLRDAGLSLNDIRDLLDYKRTASTPAEASQKMAALLGTHINGMQKKIATLRRLREELHSTISVLNECHHCPHDEFPEKCECGIGRRVDLPRAVRLLWTKS